MRCLLWHWFPFVGNKMGVGALMSQKRRCDGSLSNKQKNPPISRISGYSETWRGMEGDRGQVPVPILKISVLHTYSLILF